MPSPSDRVTHRRHGRIGGDSQVPAFAGSIGRHEQSPGLRGRTLHAARLAAAAVAILAVLVFAGKIAALYALLLHPSQATYAALEQLGISPGLRTAYTIALESMLAVVSFAVALALARFRSDSLPALLAVAVLAACGGSGAVLDVLERVDARWFLPMALLGFTYRTAFVMFVYVFPDGSFIPSWTRWLALFWTANFLMFALPATVPLSASNWHPMVGLSLEVLAIGSLLYAQVYRYRYVSDAGQQVQTRWVVFGMVVLLSVSLLAEAPAYFVPSLSVPGTANLLYDMVFLAVRDVSLLLIPLTIGMAILYHRLYDIDLIINRTIVYGLLTAILGGLFSATVVLSQRLFVALTGQKSDGAMVLATLVIVAVYTPIKNRLQETVDRRFKEPPNRVKRLQAFGEQVRLRLAPVEARPLMGRLLDEAVSAFDAEGGFATLEGPEEQQPIRTGAGWQGEAALALPLMAEDRRLGTLSLGARRDGHAYTPRDRALLSPVIGAVAEAIVHDQGGPARGRITPNPLY